MSAATASKLTASDLVLINYLVKNPYSSANTVNYSMAVDGSRPNYAAQLVNLHKAGWLVLKIDRYTVASKALAFVAKQLEVADAAAATALRVVNREKVLVILNKRRLWRQLQRSFEKPDLINIFNLAERINSKPDVLVALLEELERDAIVYRYSINEKKRVVWATTDLPELDAETEDGEQDNESVDGQFSSTSDTMEVVQEEGNNRAQRI
jgi:hypothetical protein